MNETEQSAEDIQAEALKLINSLLDEELPPSGAARLEQLLHDRPEVRRLYVLQMHLWCCPMAYVLKSAQPVDLDGAEVSGTTDELSDAMILPSVRESREEETTVTLPPLPPARAAQAARGRWKLQPRQAGLAAAVMLASAVALLFVVRHAILGHRSPEPIAMGRSLNAVWANTGAAAPQGDVVEAGVLQSLLSGYVELKSANGATVVVQGPANFAVEKGGVLRLDRGSLTASVPRPARGFTVSTPVARIVDLGTEFGVSVSQTGETSVQTFLGTVSVAASGPGGGAAPVRVAAGSARQVTSQGDINELPPDRLAFVTPRQFQDWNEAAATHNSFQRWSAYSKRLRHDPDLVAYYTFDKSADAPDRLLNQSSAGAALDGVLGEDDPDAKPTWAAGRWPEKGALAFGGAGDARVIVHSGVGDPLDFARGTLPASPFTIAAWVFVAAASDTDAAIVAKGFVGAEQFGLDLGRELGLRAWVRDQPRGPLVAGSEIRGEALSPGGWIHLATVFDPAAHSIKLYVNGRSYAHREDVSEVLMSTDQPVTIGARRDSRGEDGTINYGQSFDGRMDELAFFRRAFSADEVRDMYQTGNPD